MGGPNPATLLIASDAQANTSPTDGFIPLVAGALWGGLLSHHDHLGTWGDQKGDSVTCIAVCKRSEIITTLWDLRNRVRGRRILLLLDNSASCTHSSRVPRRTRI